MFTVGYSEGSNWNDTHWKHERFDQLLLSARTERDDDKRREIYYEMQRLIHDEGGNVIPVFTSNLLAHKDTLGHGPVVGAFELDNFQLTRRWWFES